jgi:hypothetical protein
MRSASPRSEPDRVASAPFRQTPLACNLLGPQRRLSLGVRCRRMPATPAPGPRQLRADHPCTFQRDGQGNQHRQNKDGNGGVGHGKSPSGDKIVVAGAGPKPFSGRLPGPVSRSSAAPGARNAVGCIPQTGSEQIQAAVTPQQTSLPASHRLLSVTVFATLFHSAQRECLWMSAAKRPH